MRGKQDANQQAIAEALRKVGCAVVDLSNVGDGCPDLLVHWQHESLSLWIANVALFEVKTAKGKEKPSQVKFAKEWPGKIYTVHSVDEALAVVRGEA